MASSTTEDFETQAASMAMERRECRRRISREAGRALEILGHAIEYVTDEFVHEGGAISTHNDQLDAVQLLMAVNREIYFECPEAPTFSERCLSLLHFRSV